NTSKQVARRTYAWNDWRVTGYARPKYPSVNEPAKKSIHNLANEVIQGKWGNGDERISRLKKASYDSSTVQNEVNQILKKNFQKSNETIAKEVIQGKWGNGQERKKRLTEAGYSYSTIQKLVNRMI